MFGNRKQVESQIRELYHRVDKVLDELMKVSQAQKELEITFERDLDRFKALTDEIDARIDRGNKIWRQIRARERAQAERQEYEGEEEEDEQLHFEHGTGSNGQGVRPMYGDMAPPGATLQPYQEVARRIAWMKAGRS